MAICIDFAGITVYVEETATEISKEENPASAEESLSEEA